MPNFARKTTAVGAASLALALCAGAASAANLIANGTFNGDLSGWTVGGTVISADGAIYHPCCGTPVVTTPTFAAFGPGNVGDTNTVSQSFTTTIGRAYKVSFESGALGGGTQDLSYALSGGGSHSGTITETANNSITGTFSPTSFTFTATGSSTTLTFTDVSFGNGDSGDSIDPVLTGVCGNGSP